MNSVAFSAGAADTLFCAADCGLYAFDLRRPEILLNHAAYNVCDCADEINQIAVNDNGSQVAVGDDTGAVHIYNVQSGSSFEPVITLETHANLCTTVCFASQSTLLSGGLDSAVCMLDIAAGEMASQVVFKPSAQTQQVTNPPLVHCVAAAPEGPQVAVALGDGNVAVLEIDEKQLRLWAMMEEGHTASVSQVRWLAEGRHIVSGGNDDHINLWAPYTGSMEAFRHGSKVNWMATTAENAVLVADQSNAVTVLSLE